MSVDKPDVSAARNSAFLSPGNVQAASTTAHPIGTVKQKAHVAHRVRGRIRIKLAWTKARPKIIADCRELLSDMPGVVSVRTNPEAGSIIIHYDPKRESEFERHFSSYATRHLETPAASLAGDEITQIAYEIEAEAEFLAAHSTAARATVDFFKAVDRELKVITGNAIDLKIAAAAGLAVYMFLEVGVEASTPMWVTLALFAFNHFIELHTSSIAA